MGTFVARMAQLEAEVGDGDLIMGSIVGQAYAADQHNKTRYKHPRGGMAKYLEVPFAAQREEMMERLALNAVVPQGSHLRRAGREISEMFDEMVERYAPVQKDNLRDSTYSYVLDNGRLIYASDQRDARIPGKYRGVPGPEENR